MNTDNPDSKPLADWCVIELDYRAGIKTLRQIAGEHGITHGAINNRAKAEGWSRDLSARIDSRVQAKLSKRVSRKSTEAENQFVEKASDLVANAIIGQRRSIGRARDAIRYLFGKLEGLMDNINQLDHMATILADQDGGAMQEQLRKVASLSSQADLAKKLSESLRVLIELECRVLRIKDDTPERMVAAPEQLPRMTANEAYALLRHA